MELKVWVDGIQRVICGVSEGTTCQDIVLALAHATGRTGRFTLIERWRNNERPLAPVEQPLQVLQKWGEYATDVQFMLIQTDTDGLKSPTKSKVSQEKNDRFTHNFTPPQQGDPSIKRSFTFSGAHSGNSITSPAKKKERFREAFHESSISEESEFGSSSTKSPTSSAAKSPSRSLHHRHPGANLANHRLESHSPHNSLERNPRRKAPNPSVPVNSQKTTGSQLSRSNARPIPKPRLQRGNVSNTTGPKSLDTFLSQNSPPDFQEARSSSPLPEFEEYDLDKNFPRSSSQSRTGNRSISQSKSDPSRVGNHVIAERDSTSSSDESPEYSSLVRLVALQQERLHLQESQISIIETEIKNLEDRGKADEERLKDLETEILNWEEKHGDCDQELLELDTTRWDDQLESETKSEQSLESHIESLKAQLTHCEQELVKMTLKKDSITNEIATVQKDIEQCEKNAKESELKTVQEIDDLQKQINSKSVQHDVDLGKMEELTKDVEELETTISNKKTEIADLENTLKEANLQQFVITPPLTPTSGLEEGSESALFKQLSRPSVTRKHAVSPQDFTSIVTTTITTTSENPDGVWV